jgi:hypothetical protein
MFSRMTPKEVAIELGVSRQRVQQIRARLGIEPLKRKRPDVGDIVVNRCRVLGRTDDLMAYRLCCPCGREFIRKRLSKNKERWICGGCTLMHRKYAHLIGVPNYFERLTLREFVGFQKASFDCDCGTKGFVAMFNNVLCGRTKSCGCRLAEYSEFMRSYSPLLGPGLFAPKDLLSKNSGPVDAVAADGHAEPNDTPLRVEEIPSVAG